MNSGAPTTWPPAALHPLADEVSRHADSTRKKVHWAFLRWMLLGSHYLYLRRPFTQLLFWATLGGLLLWWLVDLTRLGDLVRRHNQRTLSALLDEYHDLLELRVRSQLSQPADPEPRVFQAQPTASPPDPMGTGYPAFETRPGAILLLSCALVTAAALYLFNPPPLFPR